MKNTCVAKTCNEAVKLVQTLPLGSCRFVDVREADEVQAGTLPNSLWLPLSEIEEFPNEAKKKLPSGTKLFLFCRSGNRAKSAARILLDLGVADAHPVVEGGYEDLKRLLPATEIKQVLEDEVGAESVAASSHLLFQRFVDPDTSTYSFVVADFETKEALIVDSVREQVPQYVDYLKSRGLKLKYLLETHVHADHITGNGLLLKEFPNAVVALSEKSNVRCESLRLKNKDKLSVGRITVQAFCTPGHTHESMCFLVDGNRLLTGDTLLIDSCGRTDFQAGNSAEMYASLRWIASLPDETLLYPGHDYKQRWVSNVGEQKTLNPLLKMNRDQLSAELASWQLPPPRKIRESVKGNLVCGLSEGES